MHKDLLHTTIFYHFMAFKIYVGINGDIMNEDRDLVELQHKSG